MEDTKEIEVNEGRLSDTTNLVEIVFENIKE